MDEGFKAALYDKLHVNHKATVKKWQDLHKIAHPG
jgi:hypothetical protein